MRVYVRVFARVCTCVRMCVRCTDEAIVLSSIVGLAGACQSPVVEPEPEDHRRGCQAHGQEWQGLMLQLQEAALSLRCPADQFWPRD